jgi:hypothetical protein
MLVIYNMYDSQFHSLVGLPTAVALKDFSIVAFAAVLLTVSDGVLMQVEVLVVVVLVVACSCSGNTGVAGFWLPLESNSSRMEDAARAWSKRRARVSLNCAAHCMAVARFSCCVEEGALARPLIPAASIRCNHCHSCWS